MIKRLVVLTLLISVIISACVLGFIGNNERMIVVADNNSQSSGAIRVVKKTRITPTSPVFYPKVEPVGDRGPLPDVLGRPLKWVAENGDKWKGWSLTGYSHGWLSEEFNPCRVKFGLINGDLDSSRLYNYQSERQWREFAEWEKEVESRPVLGFCITITF